MIEKRLEDLKTLIPDFDEISLTKKEILSKNISNGNQNKKYLNKKNIFCISFLLLLLVTVISCIIFSDYSSKKNIEKNKEIIKQEINAYIDSLEESSVIPNSEEYIKDIINEKVESVSKTTNDEELKNIIEDTKENVTNVIITEESSKELIETLYASGQLTFVESSFDSLEITPLYSSFVEFRNCFRFYGSYNGASVLFSETKENSEIVFEILGYEFYFKRGFEILVTKDKKTYKLNDEEDLRYMLNNGILQESDIKEIYRIHNTWENE
ncbi:MAG: hypothetical protein E7183_00720 [Erysipelotrichaceae bacterium]|nr:hypothetical protein [Erysipelotrichaceae bacterium]